MASRRVWHGFRLINGRLVRFGTQNACDAMLIVCPNCSTSYAIEPASLGAAGRTVRCARCKTTWFANGPQAVPEMATADTAGEAQEAFKGVIRPDQPLGTAGEAGAPPPEETDHPAETMGHGG